MAIGYTPQLLYCAQCTRDLEAQAHTFSPRLGGLLCTTCATTSRQTLTVSSEALAYLRGTLADDSTVEPRHRWRPPCSRSLNDSYMRT